MKTLLLALVLALPAFGGSGLVLTTGLRYPTLTQPNVPSSQTFRFEGGAHGWVVPSTTSELFDLNGIGMSMEFLSNGQLRLTNKRDTITGATCQVDMSQYGTSNWLFRGERDLATNA